MNLYMIFTTDIHPIGGNQLFTSEIVRYFDNRENWDVRVIHHGRALGKCMIDSLNPFLDGGNLLFLNYKPAELVTEQLEVIYNHVLDNIGIKPDDYEEILIGSYNNNMSVWAEYFAKKMNGRMICFDVSEVFRGHGLCYEEYIDFFKFKYYRGELFSLDINRLFEGYLHVDNALDYKIYATEGNPIQEVSNSVVDRIYKSEFNIAYIGRAHKKYVPAVIRAVREFALRHTDKSIQFIMVGDAEVRIKAISEKLMVLPNVKVLLLGDMVPIPKILFDKVDVVLAGSGAANYSSREKVPVIVIDAENCMANGVLGYTCGSDELLYHRADNLQYKIEDLIDDVLITKSFLNSRIALIGTPNSDERISAMIEKFNTSSSEKEYYDVEKETGIIVKKQLALPDFSEEVDVIRKKIALWKKLNKTIIFGAGKDGDKCLDFLHSINVSVDAYIDNDETRWYTELRGVDIFSVDYLCTITNYTIIISSTKYSYEMKQQLMELDCVDGNAIILFGDLMKYDRALLICD